MTVSRPYFTLVSFDRTDDSPAWAVEFGDYDRQCVVDERDDLNDGDPTRRFKIITSADDQASINEAVAAL